MNNQNVDVYLGIGSNFECENNINFSLTELRRYFGKLKQSPVYRSPPLNSLGDDYLNLVVFFKTDKPLSDLSRLLKLIENQLGRERASIKPEAMVAGKLNKPQESNARKVTIDLDILIYGDLVGKVESFTFPHHDVLNSPHVLKPLSELSPNLIHPIEKLTMAELWRRYDAQKNSGLKRIKLS